MKHLSISERLRKAKSIEAKRETLLDWRSNWLSEQLKIIKNIEHAINHDDYDTLCKSCWQLRTITNKRFNGLLNIINNLLTK